MQNKAPKIRYYQRKNVFLRQLYVSYILELRTGGTRILTNEVEIQLE